MKSVIIFGGAFNPPSRGHVWILSECSRIAREIDAEVWVLPSGERYDKQIGVSNVLRLELCRAMVRDADTAEGVVVKMVHSELERAMMVETIDTVKELEKRYSDRHFIWVFGADSYASMDRWRGGQWLVSHLDMIIVTRAGFIIEPRDNVRVIAGVHDDISSTQIRDAHGRHRDIGALVTPKVAELLGSGKIRYTNG